MCFAPEHPRIHLSYHFILLWETSHWELKHVCTPKPKYYLTVQSRFTSSPKCKNKCNDQYLPTGLLTTREYLGGGHRHFSSQGTKQK